jgi:hypothetical protein
MKGWKINPDDVYFGWDGSSTAAPIPIFAKVNEIHV